MLSVYFMKWGISVYRYMTLYKEYWYLLRIIGTRDAICSA